MKDLFTFLEMAGAGGISGNVSEWPQLKPACKWAADFAAAFKKAYADIRQLQDGFASDESWSVWDESVRQKTIALGNMVFDDMLSRHAAEQVPSENSLKVNEPGSACPHGNTQELDGRCSACDCGKPSHAQSCAFVASMLRGALNHPALADRVIELIVENEARREREAAVR